MLLAVNFFLGIEQKMADDEEDLAKATKDIEEVGRLVGHIVQREQAREWQLPQGIHAL